MQAKETPAAKAPAAKNASASTAGMSKEQLAAKVSELEEELARMQRASGDADASAEVESIHKLEDRMSWLVGLLILQSFSSIILSHFHTLIETHESIIFFLTMLVGAGGNAGGQSVVMAV